MSQWAGTHSQLLAYRGVEGRESEALKSLSLLPQEGSERRVRLKWQNLTAGFSEPVQCMSARSLDSGVRLVCSLVLPLLSC